MTAPVPQPWRWLLGNWTVVVLCLVPVVAFAGFGVTSCSRRASIERAVTAEAAAITGDEATAAAVDVQRVVVDVGVTDRAIDAQTMENRDAILSAAGARSDIPPAVAGAGRAALCLRPTYRADPACQQLRDADPD